MTKQIRDKILDLEALVKDLWNNLDDYIKSHKSPPDEAVKQLKSITKILKILEDGK